MVRRRQGASCLAALLIALMWVVSGAATGHWVYSLEWTRTSTIEPHKGAGCSFFASTSLAGGIWLHGRCYDPETWPDCKSLWVRVTAVSLDRDWRSMVSSEPLQRAGAALDLFASFGTVLVWVEVWDSLCDGQPDHTVSLMGRGYDGPWKLDAWTEGFRTLPNAMPEEPLIAYWIGPSDARSVSGGFDLLLYATEGSSSGMGIGATGRVTFTCTWAEDAVGN